MFQIDERHWSEINYPTSNSPSAIAYHTADIIGELYNSLRPQTVASGASPSLRTLLILSGIVRSQNFYIC